MCVCFVGRLGQNPKPRRPVEDFKFACNMFLYYEKPNKKHTNFRVSRPLTTEAPTTRPRLYFVHNFFFFFPLKKKYIFSACLSVCLSLCVFFFRSLFDCTRIIFLLHHKLNRQEKKQQQQPYLNHTSNTNAVEQNNKYLIVSFFSHCFRITALFIWMDVSFCIVSNFQFPFRLISFSFCTSFFHFILTFF